MTYASEIASAGPRMASRPRTRSAVTSSAPCASCDVRRPNRHLSLCRSGAVHSQPIRLIGSSSALGREPAWPSKRTLTCSAMLAATRWRARVTIPAHCRITLGTRISSTQCGTRSSRRQGLRISGAKPRGDRWRDSWIATLPRPAVDGGRSSQPECEGRCKKPHRLRLTETRIIVGSTSGQESTTGKIWLKNADPQ